MAGWGRDGQDHGWDSFPQPQPAHNPCEVKLPKWFDSVMTCKGDARRSSFIMLDSRDDGMVSPFQAELVKEIMTNTASSINVLTERDHMMPPTSDYYHIWLFANYTLNGVKAMIAISVDSTTGCGGWDAETARALAHEASQPFS